MKTPPPLTYGESKASLIEEIADVRLCIKVIERAMQFNTKGIEYMKLKRWFNRIVVKQYKKV